MTFTASHNVNLVNRRIGGCVVVSVLTGRGRMMCDVMDAKKKGVGG